VIWSMFTISSGPWLVVWDSLWEPDEYQGIGKPWYTPI
jgi:hypothetical protein